MKCYYCSKETPLEICKECDEKASAKRTQLIWNNNKRKSHELSEVYYDYILDVFRDRMKNDSKENFGFNMFAEGINMGLDIVMPFLDDDLLQGANKKIRDMIDVRSMNKKKK